MKIGLISDIHGNMEALSALPKPFDELWVLGDLVNYGPNPSEVVDYVKANATVVIRGNHDYAVGFGEDPRCSATFRAMAQAMQEYTMAVLSDQQKSFLRELPLKVDRNLEGVKVSLCHAVPSDPLFAYCPPESDRWADEIKAVTGDALLVGHTHVPFQREFEGKRVVNPGSIGQPKIGRPEACYAVWDTSRADSPISLRTFEYSFEKTIRKIEVLPLPAEIKSSLASVLRYGGLR
jgi:putative phosphoesterase